MNTRFHPSAFHSLFLVATAALTAALAAVPSTGCSFLTMKELCITSFRPEKELLPAIDGVEVEAEFSGVMNRASAEEAFSLTADGGEVYGRFRWPNGTTLRFEPHAPLCEEYEYLLRIGTGAEDENGNSLSAPFVHRFSAKEDFTRPRVKTARPGHGSTVEDLRAPVVLEFDEAMSQESVTAAFSLTPALRGCFKWDGGGTVFSFFPLEPYRNGEEYTVRLSSEAADRCGNRITAEWELRFSAGIDRSPPQVLSVSDGTGDVVLAHDSPDDGEYTRTTGWEREHPFVLRFSEPVNRSSAEAAIEISPPVYPRFGWPEPESDTLRLTPEEPLEWGREYVLTVGEDLRDLGGNCLEHGLRYPFLTDGPRSRPPQITEAWFFTDPAVPEGDSVTHGQQISLEPYDGGERGWFDLYVRCAQGARMDPFAVMEQVSLGITGEAADAVMIAVEEGDVSPAPYRVPGEDESLIRLVLDIENRPGPGILTLTVYGEACDTLGNPMGEDWTLRLNTVD